MLVRIRNLITKYWDILVYLFFGGLTTLVNFLVYFPLYNFLGFSASFSNVIAWAVAVVFAYLTNKPFVFKSWDWSSDMVFPELLKFVSCRAGSGAVETLLLFLAVDFLGWNGNVWKVITSIVVVILNYIGSKFLVFKK